jgi:hypothetical protein
MSIVAEYIIAQQKKGVNKVPLSKSLEISTIMTSMPGISARYILASTLTLFVAHFRIILREVPAARAPVERT